MRLTFPGFVVALFLTAWGQDCFATEASYYTWVDENGVVNYSQGQPKGVNARLVSKGYRFGVKVVEQPTDQPAPAAPPDIVGNDVGPSTEATQAEADFEKTMKEISRVKLANCKGAKRNLARYLNRGRIRLKGEDGQYRILSDEERQQNISRYQKDIDENC